MKKIACLGVVALLAVCGCESNKKGSNMSVMSDKDKAPSCCSENKDAKSCSDKSADKSNMSVISEKKECSESSKVCPVTGKAVKE